MAEVGENKLTPTISEADYRALDKVVEGGLESFVETGKALAKIQETKGYRYDDYSTFAVYCLMRFNMSRSYAYRQITAAQVYEIVSPIGDIPLNESICRELTPLLPTPRQESKPTKRPDTDSIMKRVWKRVLSLANKNGGTITAKLVRDEVAKELPQSPSWLKFTDIWNFSACDPRFGTDYPGRIPGQIVQNVLYRWTEESDLVVDPMAGGGVTIDVCKAMKRRCVAFDLEPARDDIQKHDARQPWPMEEKVDAIFIDPPYWSQLEDDYVGVAQEDYAGYMTAMEQILRAGVDVLKDDSILAVLIAPMAIKTEYLDLPFELVQTAKGLGLKLMRRISVPVSSQQVGPRVTAYCRDNGILIALLRDLLVFTHE